MKSATKKVVRSLVSIIISISILLSSTISGVAFAETVDLSPQQEEEGLNTTYETGFEYYDNEGELNVLPDLPIDTGSKQTYLIYHMEGNKVKPEGYKNYYVLFLPESTVKDNKIYHGKDSDGNFKSFYYTTSGSLGKWNFYYWYYDVSDSWTSVAITGTTAAWLTAKTEYDGYFSYASCDIYDYYNQSKILYTFPNQPEISLSNATSFNGNSYAISNKGMNWHEAKQYCEGLGGHLATITSQEEQDFIASLIESRGNRNFYWLGATDESEEGTWTWITGEQWEYTNWEQNQPDNYGAVDCQYYDNEGKLNILPDLPIDTELNQTYLIYHMEGNRVKPEGYKNYYVLFLPASTVRDNKIYHGKDSDGNFKSFYYTTSGSLGKWNFYYWYYDISDSWTSVGITGSAAAWLTAKTEYDGYFSYASCDIYNYHSKNEILYTFPNTLTQAEENYLSCYVAYGYQWNDLQESGDSSGYAVKELGGFVCEWENTDNDDDIDDIDLIPLEFVDTNNIYSTGTINVYKGTLSNGEVRYFIEDDVDILLADDGTILGYSLKANQIAALDPITLVTELVIVVVAAYTIDGIGGVAVISESLIVIGENIYEMGLSVYKNIQRHFVELKELKDSVDNDINDILKDAEPGRETMGRTTQYEKEGGMGQAEKDFEYLNPSQVKDIENGKRGILPDGRDVNVRRDSTDGRPTLEIQNPNKTRIKIRYNE